MHRRGRLHEEILSMDCLSMGLPVMTTEMVLLFIGIISIAFSECNQVGTRIQYQNTVASALFYCSATKIALKHSVVR